MAGRVGHGLISQLGSGVGILMKYGQGAGRGQWGAWAQGGLRRGPKTSPERGEAGVRPVPHKSRAPARSVQAAHREEGWAGGPREKALIGAPALHRGGNG